MSVPAPGADLFAVRSCGHVRGCGMHRLGVFLLSEQNVPALRLYRTRFERAKRVWTDCTCDLWARIQAVIR